MLPFEITPVEEATNEKLMKLFKGEQSGFIQVGPKKYILPARFAEQAEGYYNFELRPDDVWINTFPRSGTTVTQDLIWLVNNNLDYESAGKYPLHPNRFPFFEFSILHHPKLHEKVMKDNPDLNEEDLKILQEPGYDFINKMTSPRHIKTHLPFSLLPSDLVKRCKVIYMARNAKDVAVSYYHHNKLLKVHDYQGDFNQYWDLFENDLLVDAPFFEHIREAWELRTEANMLFLFYEDLITDMKGSIKKIADFLGKPITDENADELAKYLHINNYRQKVKVMRETSCAKALSNHTAQGFIRKGQIGGNEEFTEELTMRADKWIQSKLSDTDLKFPV